jgi:hypothetical protein
MGAMTSVMKELICLGMNAAIDKLLQQGKIDQITKLLTGKIRNYGKVQNKVGTGNISGNKLAEKVNIYLKNKKGPITIEVPVAAQSAMIDQLLKVMSKNK